MDIDQLKSNWQQQLAQKPIDELSDWEKDSVAIENKMKALDKNVQSRTLYGTIMFVLILVSMIALGYLSYLVGVSFLSMLGLATFFVVIAVTMIRTFMVKRRYNMNDSALTILESLQHMLAKINSEIKFYLSLVWTVLAPMSIGCVLIPVGSNASLLVTAGITTFFILCCYFSYRYNKYYVAKNLTPIKEEILANLKAL
jgi:membrane protein YdbS with pleckstrin-like domain